jgi:undecaprenyl-diphosphatase
MSGKSLLLSTRGALEAGDLNLMRRVHRWRAPRWIRIWMLCATRGGDGWIWYGMGAVVAAFGGPSRFLALGCAALAATLGILLFLVLKRRIGRRRPCALLPHCWSTLLPPDQFSFPSGHTITAFAVSISLIAFYPGLAIGLLFCACSIGLSRILLGMHFLTDVLAGALLGTLIARLSIHCLTLLLT